MLRRIILPVVAGLVALSGVLVAAPASADRNPGNPTITRYANAPTQAGALETCLRFQRNVVLEGYVLVKSCHQTKSSGSFYYYAYVYRAP